MIPTTRAYNHKLKIVINSVGCDTVPRLGPLVHEVLLRVGRHNHRPKVTSRISVSLVVLAAT